MTTTTIPSGTAATTSTARPPRACDPTVAVTRSLLGYGVLAGPVYVGVSLAQALTRDGFDLSRHSWSLLANGDLGWLQITNLALAGLMVVAFAVGLRRAMAGGPDATWAPRLLGVYGVSLVAAGVFRADPALGFPVGAPEIATVSWHGLLHFVAGGIGFACVAAACFAVARGYAAAGRRGFARGSRMIGVTFFTGFAMLAASGGSRTANLLFTAAVVLIWGWIGAVALDRYRTAN